jgi:hypothetical protein
MSGRAPDTTAVNKRAGGIECIAGNTDDEGDERGDEEGDEQGGAIGA